MPKYTEFEQVGSEIRRLLGSIDLESAKRIIGDIRFELSKIEAVVYNGES
jgi:hypothetical protein